MSTHRGRTYKFLRFIQIFANGVLIAFCGYLFLRTRYFQRKCRYLFLRNPYFQIKCLDLIDNNFFYLPKKIKQKGVKKEQGNVNTSSLITTTHIS